LLDDTRRNEYTAAECLLVAFGRPFEGDSDREYAQRHAGAVLVARGLAAMVALAKSPK
jgi:hypothetical protein